MAADRKIKKRADGTAWEDNIDGKLMEQIKALPESQLREVVIYFCGYENGEALVKQAIEGMKPKKSKLPNLKHGAET